MLKAGMYVADRYEIVGKIGTGGMSNVYKAKDQILGRFVAIKVLKQEFSEDVNFLTKFRTEAQSAAGLEHPNIVNIYDVGNEDGLHFIVMEYVEGVTLKTYIEKKGQLSYKEAVSIAIQVGRGIEAAHNKHIIHRDIKPQNVIISTEGKVKVTDFGIARAANSNTIHSDVMGSVHYTSPEQARNGFVDGKSDIYSLGIVMYEMVTGRVPFDGDTTVAIAIQHLQEEMTAPSAFAPNLPISLEKVIQKCTQKNPDRRYETISDLLADLKKVLISPDEDFVTMIPLRQDTKTRVIPAEDVASIKKEAERVYQEEEPEDYEEEEDEDYDYEEEEDDGGFLNPKMEKAVTIAGIVAAVIIVAIIVVILGNVTGLFKFGKNRDKEEDNQTKVEEDIDKDKEEEEPEEELVTMISLEGSTEEEARAALKELGLGLEVTGTMASDDYEEGQIVAQSVKKGEKVEKHTTIEVQTSSGPGEFEAPSVVGKDESEAERIIKDNNLVPKRDFAFDDTVPEGEVISQSPEAGTAVKEGDTITYIISQGVETVKVPDVTNKPEADARAELEAAGFPVSGTTSEYDDTVGEGCVIRQSPGGGEYKEVGTPVSLVISMGKRTAYYYYEGTFDKPDADAKVTKVELIGEGYGAIPCTPRENENSVTISATNIENCSGGVLTITWEWTKPEVKDEAGVVIQPAEVKTHTTGPLNVSFRQQ